MDENKAEIQKYNSERQNLSITKNKNMQYHVRDGFVNYVVNIDRLNCPCKTTKILCKHIIHVLRIIYLLDFDTIEFFHKLSDHFFLNIKNKSTINEILKKILYSEILGDDCAICMNSLISKCDVLSECVLCTKYCHKKCIQKWMDKNKNTQVQCVYCVSGSMIKKSHLS